MARGHWVPSFPRRHAALPFSEQTPLHPSLGLRVLFPPLPLGCSPSRQVLPKWERLFMEHPAEVAVMSPRPDPPPVTLVLRVHAYCLFHPHGPMHVCHSACSRRAGAWHVSFVGVPAQGRARGVGALGGHPEGVRAWLCASGSLLASETTLLYAFLRRSKQLVHVPTAPSSVRPSCLLSTHLPFLPFFLEEEAPSLCQGSVSPGTLDPTCLSPFVPCSLEFTLLCDGDV